jgi:hypothetical protein
VSGVSAGVVKCECNNHFPKERIGEGTKGKKKNKKKKEKISL